MFVINEILFILLIIAIISAIKYYVFDIPLKDKKLYQLNAFYNQLEKLVRDGVACRLSREYMLMKRIIEKTQLLIINQVPISSMTIGELFKYFSSYKKSKLDDKYIINIETISNKTLQTLTENEQLFKLYNQIEDFLIKNTGKRIM